MASAWVGNTFGSQWDSKLGKVVKVKVAERDNGCVHHSTFWQRHTPAQLL